MCVLYFTQIYMKTHYVSVLIVSKIIVSFEVVQGLSKYKVTAQQAYKCALVKIICQRS
jgi:hypothetical protein